MTPELCKKKPMVIDELEPMIQPVLDLYGCTIDQVTSKTHRSPIAECRLACYYLLHTKGYDKKEIGKKLNRHRTTVHDGINRIKNYIELYKEYKKLKELCD